MEATAPISGLTTTTTTDTSSQASIDAATLTSDFDTFLQLLTAQLENQDPLEPVDSTQFVEQLATFSSVEQQIQTNSLLESILGALGGDNNELASWVGQLVEAEAPVRFTGAPIDLMVTPNPDAETTELVVRDALGTEVYRRDIDDSVSKVTWDGTLTAGGTAEPGLYSFRIARTSEGNPLPTEVPSGFSLVKEARLESGQISLVLDGGTTIPASEVTALRSST